MMSTADENTWRTPGFRQSMVNKIEEAITHCGSPTSKNAVEMEVQVFSKAKSKDEYLSFVARLIIHIKEMGSKKVVGMAGQQQTAGQGNLGSQILPQMGGPQQTMGMMNQIGNMSMMNSQGMVPMNQNQSSMMQAMTQPQQLGQQQLLSQQQLNQQPNNSNQIGNMGMMNSQGMVPMNQNQSSMMQALAQQQQHTNLIAQQQQTQQQQQLSQQQQSMLAPCPMYQQTSPLRAQQQQHQGQQSSEPANQQTFMQQQQPQHATMQNVQQGQMQQNSQLQDHLRNTQMGGGVQLANVQIQNAAMSQMGTGPINSQVGPPVGDNQIRAQLQSNQQQMHPQIPGQIVTSSMQQQLIQQQQQSQQGGRMVGRMMGPQSAMPKAAQRNIHRAPNVHNANIPNMPNPFTGPNTLNRNITPSQYIVPSPVQGNIGQTLSPGPPSNQGQNPSYLTQSTLMPSPAAPGITANNLRSFQGQHGVPSPGSSLNTPLMAVSTPSPRNAEDQACIDKIRELQKYTDLLQRMIAKFGNDDVEKSSKMKKLLEILTNPNQRVSMEILLKCEVALRKMERQQNDPGGVLTGGPTPQPPAVKDQSQVSPFQQILDALAGALRTPSSSHTLLRTFRPTVEALTGHSFGACFQNNYYEEDVSSDSESTDNDIPSVLKRELRALDSHFKVSIFRRGGGMVRLRVANTLDPRVPPLKINVRSDYPYDPPVVVHLTRDYGSTAFLKAVGRTYKSRFVRLAPNHTVTELLHLWHSCLGVRK